MKKPLILVIDDEADLVELVQYNLAREGFEVETAPDGRTGLDRALRSTPDLVILDLMLPGMHGLEVCRRLRGARRTARLPILMLTALQEESDRVAGLETGADDYVTKPFSLKELMARTRALLRRSDRSAPQPEPAPPAGSLLLGAVAFEQGLLARGQIQDALVVQERNPTRPLGEILVARRCFTEKELGDLIALQKRRIERARRGGDGGKRGVLGELVLEQALATDYQLNECLRLQGRISEMGIRPVPRLGEILLRHGYLTRTALDLVLHLQTPLIRTCPECGSSIRLHPCGDQPIHGCAACDAEPSGLSEQIVRTIDGVLGSAARAHRVDIPPEVVAAAKQRMNQFGRYVLLEKVGVGGAGTVHRAWDRNRNRVVALKILSHTSTTSSGVSTPYGDAEDVKRFFSEARAVAELNHPCIVHLLDFGTHRSSFYLAMRFIDGVPLDHLVLHGAAAFARRGRTINPSLRRRWSAPDRIGPPLRTAVSLVLQIARGVAFAHARGVCHRDLKPGNILVDERGHPWITDFGLAKVKRIGDSAYRKGVSLGTPHYMPPEQAIGDMEQVDARSDIYSLGATLYELVAGVPPYADRSSTEVFCLLPWKPPDPIERAAPHVPPPLQRIISKAMAPRKGNRYRTARGFVADLARFARTIRRMEREDPSP